MLFLFVWTLPSIVTANPQTILPTGRASRASPYRGTSDITGTSIHFHPDPDIFEEVNFERDIIVQRLRELAFLNQGLKILFADERKKSRLTGTAL